MPNNSRSIFKPGVVFFTGLLGIATIHLFGPLALSSTVAARGGGQSTAPYRALFIGNSYTYFNALPVVIRDLAAAANESRPFEPHIVLVGGSTLQAHLERRATLDAIANGKWDAIILQEQSTRPITDPALMRRDVSKFADVAAKAGTKLILYETWTREDRPHLQDSLSAVYHGVATAVGARVVHAGEAWNAFRAQEGAIPTGKHSVLFHQDGSHPTQTGTYLVASVMYATLYGRSPVGLPGVTRNTTAQPEPGPAPEAPRDSVDARLVKTIQEIAWKAARP